MMRIYRERVKLFLQGILFIVLFIVVLAFCSYFERHYSIDAQVYRVENNIVTFEDKLGELWEYEDYEEELTEGQSVKLTFYDNGTDRTRTDDEITKIKIVVDKDNN